MSSRAAATDVLAAPEATRSELAAALKVARARRDRELPAAQRRYKDVVAKREALERHYIDEVRTLAEQGMEASAVVANLDRAVAKAEAALRATCDPRIEILDRQLGEFLDFRRVHYSEADLEEVRALIPRIKTAHEQLEQLKLDPAADVDTELHRILDDVAGVSIRDLQRVAHRRNV